MREALFFALLLVVIVAFIAGPCFALLVVTSPTVKRKLFKGRTSPI